MTYTRHEIPLLKIVFKLKFFLAKHESYIILKVFKVKVLSVFGFDTFLTMLNALWWIYKKDHHGIFDFMFLVSSVLVMVSKNLSFCFRQGHLELFQCSAEGWSIWHSLWFLHQFSNQNNKYWSTTFSEKLSNYCVMACITFGTVIRNWVLQIIFVFEALKF